MTKNDVVRLFEILCSLWPSQAKNFNAGEVARDTWYAMLGDKPLELVSLAIQKLAANSIYIPSIAEIRQTIAEMESPNDFIDADEAWGIVYKSIGKYGYYNGEKALASMPIIVADTVRTMGWRDLCMSENVGVDRGQFRRAYEIRLARTKERAQTPQRIMYEMDCLINGVGVNVALENGSN